MIKFTAFILAIALSITTVFSQIKTEEITISNNEIQLPGTLTFTKENTPLVIWVHGSGNIDRNGNQAGTMVQANYIQQFREAVNANNIAFFSYDKRTANPKNKDFLKDVNFKDFALDAREVINHFKKDNRFTEITVIGHSQGSLVAMLVADKINKYISIAGSGQTIDKTIIKQITNQSAEFGKIAEAHFKELAETGTIKEVNPFLMSIFAPQNQTFMTSWIEVNPLEQIKNINKPILLINGDKDLQVKVDDAKALHEANPKSELVIIKNMNHVLKHIENDSDNMKSYTSADYPISSEVINVTVKFIKAEHKK